MLHSTLTAFLFPAAASACESMAAMTTASSGACASAHGCGGAGALALLAAVAVLGVWVLRLVDNDSLPVKRTGQVVGWTLAAVGLGGFLCGAAAYGLRKAKRSCHMSPVEAPAPGSTLPPGHPPVGAMK